MSEQLKNNVIGALLLAFILGGITLYNSNSVIERRVYVLELNAVNKELINEKLSNIEKKIEVIGDFVENIDK